MLTSNFFYKFFKQNQNNRHEIMKYDSNKEFDLEKEINLKIVEIDKDIAENSKALMEAQIVKFRSTFSQSKNFIESIGKNVYKKKLEDSIEWHQKQLKGLYIRRKELQIKLEKLKGIFWFNRIKRLLRLILISFFILLSLFIFLSGFMIIIYLLPLIILIMIGYYLANKNSLFP
tara:strand:+ start:273 stop:794 length:522 start_codon:yes stop_codon:yes gene_type:complete